MQKEKCLWNEFKSCLGLNQNHKHSLPYTLTMAWFPDYLSFTDCHACAVWHNLLQISGDFRHTGQVHWVCLGVCSLWIMASTASTPQTRRMARVFGSSTRDCWVCHSGKKRDKCVPWQMHPASHQPALAPANWWSSDAVWRGLYLVGLGPTAATESRAGPCQWSLLQQNGGGTLHCHCTGTLQQPSKVCY